MQMRQLMALSGLILSVLMLQPGGVAVCIRWERYAIQKLVILLRKSKYMFSLTFDLDDQLFSIDCNSKVDSCCPVDNINGAILRYVYILIVALAAARFSPKKFLE